MNFMFVAPSRGRRRRPRALDMPANLSAKKIAAAHVEDPPAAPSSLCSAKTARITRREKNMDAIETLQGSVARTPDRPSRGTLRSVAAVLGGLVATFAVTTAVDVVLHALGIFPPMNVRMADSLFVVAMAYRLPFNAIGAYITARPPPSPPM